MYYSTQIVYFINLHYIIMYISVSATVDSPSNGPPYQEHPGAKSPGCHLASSKFVSRKEARPEAGGKKITDPSSETDRRTTGRFPL